jgi:hypothetical protein
MVNDRPRRLEMQMASGAHIEQRPRSPSSGGSEWLRSGGAAAHGAGMKES